jgi:adenylate cyclase
VCSSDLGDILRRRDKYEKALKLYQSMEFSKALEIFTRLYDEGDAISEMFIERCNSFLVYPPSPDWDGVWVMDKK